MLRDVAWSNGSSFIAFLPPFSNFTLKAVLATDPGWGGERRCSQRMFLPEVMQSEGEPWWCHGIGCKSSSDRNRGCILGGWNCVLSQLTSFGLCIYPLSVFIISILLTYLYLSVVYLSLYSSINHLFFASVSHLLFTYYLIRAVIYILYVFIVLAQKLYRLPQNNEQSISAPTRMFASRICSEFVRVSVVSLTTSCKYGSIVKQYLGAFFFLRGNV